MVVGRWRWSKALSVSAVVESEVAVVFIGSVVAVLGDNDEIDCLGNVVVVDLWVFIEAEHSACLYDFCGTCTRGL